MAEPGNICTEIPEKALSGSSTFPKDWEGQRNQFEMASEEGRETVRGDNADVLLMLFVVFCCQGFCFSMLILQFVRAAAAAAKFLCG